MSTDVRETGGRPPSALRSVSLVAALALATPLVFARGLVFPFVVPKAFFFQALVALALSVLALEWTRGRVTMEVLRRLRPTRDPVLWALLSFIVVAALSGLSGPAPQRSLLGTLERRWGVLAWALFAGFYLTLRVSLDDTGWRRALRLVAGAGVAASAYGLLRGWGLMPGQPEPVGWSRVSGTLGNAGYLGAYLLLTAGVTAHLAISTRSARARVVWSAALIPQLVVLLLTGTRAALLGAGAGGGVVLAVWALSTRDGTVRRRAAAGLAALLAAAGALVMASGAVDSHVSSWWERLLSTLSTETHSARLRLLVWGTGVEATRETPLLGVGPENFDLVWSSGFDPRIYNVAATTSFDRAHNVVVEAAATTGLAGLSAYLAVWASLGWMLLRAWRDGRVPGASAAALGIGFVAYLVYLLFWFEDYGSFTTFVAMAAFVGHLATRHGTEESGRRGVDDTFGGAKALEAGPGRRTDAARSDGAGRRGMAVSFVLLALVGVTVWHNARVFASAREAWNGEYSMNAWDGAPLFRSALDRGLPGDQRILAAYLRRLTFLAGHGDSGSPEGPTPRMKEALAAAERAVDRWEERDRRNPDVYVQRSRLCGIVEDVRRDGAGRECARRSLERAIELSPRQIRYRHWLADHHLAAGEPGRALQVLDEALRVYGSFGETYYYRSRVHWRTGERDEAVRQSRLATSLGWGAQPSAFVQQLARWLAEEGRPADAAEMIEDHLALRYASLRNPELSVPEGKGFRPWDLQLAGTLPLLRLRSGDREAAVRTAEFVVHRLPDPGGENERRRRVQRFLADLRAGRVDAWAGVESLVGERSSAERTSAGRSPAPASSTGGRQAAEP